VVGSGFHCNSGSRPLALRAARGDRLRDHCRVLPGEIGYVTIAADGQPAESVLSEAAANAPRGWHSVLWESLQEADGPPIAATDS